MPACIHSKHVFLWMFGKVLGTVCVYSTIENQWLTWWYFSVTNFTRIRKRYSDFYYYSIVVSAWWWSSIFQKCSTPSLGKSFAGRCTGRGGLVREPLRLSVHHLLLHMEAPESLFYEIPFDSSENLVASLFITSASVREMSVIFRIIILSLFLFDQACSNFSGRTLEHLFQILLYRTLRWCC